MKTINKSLLTLFLGVAIVFALVYTSCKKDEPGNGKPDNSVDKSVIIQKANQLYKNLAEIRVVNEKNGNQLVLKTKDGSFSFANPDPGITFSSPDGVQYVSTANGGILYITAAAFGYNSGGGGGTVVAGTTNLDINYTFCLSADDQAMNLGFIDNEFNGVSMVIGLSGDLDALINNTADTTANPLDYFNGFAVYIVYQSPASGNYDVINWMDNANPQDSSVFDGNALAYVLDFQDPAIYFSSDGQLNVNGGNIGFNGKYIRFAFDFLNPDGEIDDEDFSEVDGFGTMGCN